MITTDELKPFLAWNRLEGRPRKRDFENVLKARIHDPLWMIARQWQMGEFKGNDTGSGIFARVHMDYSRITRYGAANSETPVAYDGSLPLEPLVERLLPDWSLKERVLMGKKWIALLKAAGISMSSYNSLFAADESRLFTLDMRTPESTVSDETIVGMSALHGDARVTPFLAALSGATVDGARIFQQLTNDRVPDELMTNLAAAYMDVHGSPIPPLDLGRFASANADFVSWVRKMYTLPETLISNWNSRSMEYEFDVYVPDKHLSSENRLSTNRYGNGHFDWSAFTQRDSTAYELSPDAGKETKSIQLILSSNRFAGMPATRWWEFEDGHVNFSQLSADTTDIAKIVMTQFALLYQDDWFNIPYKVPVSTASAIDGIMVTDVFGVKVLVASHKTERYDTVSKTFIAREVDWKKWDWMDISVAGSVIGEVEPIDRTLILPVLPKIQESKPIESVLFLRDEMANLVWGVEKIVPDHLGQGRDGYEAARDRRSLLRGIKPLSDPESDFVESAQTNKLKFTLSLEDIPENWIPFTAVHTGEKNRSIQLQRAAMPRIMVPYSVSLVRPRTSLLSEGLNNTPRAPLFLNEEEVTRAGTIVRASHQRARWYGGRIIHWLGRSKTTGRGEGSGGLSFDNLE